MLIVTSSVEIAIARLTNAALHLDQLPPPWPTTIRTHLNNLNTLAPNALAHLSATTRDGWNRASSGADIGCGSRPSGYTSTVESALIGRALITGNGRPIGTTAIVDDIERHITTATTWLTHAINDPNTAQQRARARTVADELKHACRILFDWYVGEHRTKERLTCACGDLPGWVEWGDLECHMIASPGTNGLCRGTRDNGTPGCFERRHAWQMRQHRARQRVDPRRHHTAA